MATDLNLDSPSACVDGAAAVRIGFGRVHHRRLAPLTRGFSYPVYFLRLRIDALQHVAPSRIAFGLVGLDRPAPISFRSSDHGDGRTPLMRWIRTLLREAGVRADGAVWLQCFPRSFGMRFKPVSFWFCHRRDGGLAAVVAEVNNTFGERHCYLLAHDDGSPIVAGEHLRARKRFHVSPFFAVDGEYRFRFEDAPEAFRASIDLLDPSGGIALVTSIEGRVGPATPGSAALALLRHPLLALGVVSRIHLQALRLWMRGIAFHRKPEPPRQPLTRGHR